MAIWEMPDPMVLKCPCAKCLFKWPFGKCPAKGLSNDHLPNDHSHVHLADGVISHLAEMVIQMPICQMTIQMVIGHLAEMVIQMPICQMTIQMVSGPLADNHWRGKARMIIQMAIWLMWGRAGREEGKKRERLGKGALGERRAEGGREGGRRPGITI